MDFVPSTDTTIRQMLEKIGVSSVEDLTKEFKPHIKEKLDLPPPLSEMELVEHMGEKASTNSVSKYFVGAGSYNHYSPSAVNHILLRGEFSTAYTPYQPEASQGTLQAMYEFQTFVCLLTGMDLANASLYDGASALSEAVLLSCSYNKRKNVCVSNTINPSYYQVLKTYCEGADLSITQEIDDKTACVVVQNPDFYGNIENHQQLADKAHKNGALFITCITEPTSLAIVKPPAEYGADITVGEGQAFGVPISYGGPYVGFIAVKNFLLKKIPGRIAGMTTDSNGNQGFVLTFQAREQHIRRERATSNITTNQALLALATTAYLSLMGKTGLYNVAKTCHLRAHDLCDKMKKNGFTLLNSKPFYNEFLVKKDSGNVADTLSKLADNGIIGGLEIEEDKMLVCCTEMNYPKDIENYISVLGE